MVFKGGTLFLVLAKVHFHRTDIVFESLIQQEKRQVSLSPQITNKPSIQSELDVQGNKKSFFAQL
jgi:hypothetical protein